MSNKTTAISIIGVQVEGVLVERVVEEGGVLPGHCLMVSDQCTAVLVAGDKATAKFDVGPHDLDLMMFNRQPSGLLYGVGLSPQTLTWSPAGDQVRRSVSLRVSDPILFVQEAVVGSGAENDGELTKVLGQTLDAVIAPGTLQDHLDQAITRAGDLLGKIGCTLIELREESLADIDGRAQTSKLRSTPTGPTAQIEKTPVLLFTHVWSSSTMDMFGKGELTLRVRLLGRDGPDFSAHGPFTYDATQEYLSPDDWLQEKTWQEMPTQPLRFEGLVPSQYYRLFIFAEERDRKSADALGSLEAELGQLSVQDLELGPTVGGKRGHHIKIRGKIE